VHLIYLDRPGDDIGATLACRKQKGQENPQNCWAKIRPKLQDGQMLSKIAGEVETSRPMAGYSETPLVRKLGIGPNERVVAINAPAYYAKLLGDLPEGAAFAGRAISKPNFVHLFVTQRRDLEKQLNALRRKLNDAGVIWVSWPKKSARVVTDITEDTIRAVALPLGLVDVKVCAVDETWSGLKLMIRRENRKQ